MSELQQRVMKVVFFQQLSLVMKLGMAIKRGKEMWRYLSKRKYLNFLGCWTGITADFFKETYL